MVQLAGKANRLLDQSAGALKVAQVPRGMCEDGPRRHPGVYSNPFTSLAGELPLGTVERQFEVASRGGQVSEQ